MEYFVQSRVSAHGPLTKQQWLSNDGWLSNDVGGCNRTAPRKFNSAEKAIRFLEADSELARMIWPLRVITSAGDVLLGYDPECDTRLPGCRHRIIMRNAYQLWEAAGSPECDGTEFWHKAESSLQESNGLVVP